MESLLSHPDENENENDDDDDDATHHPPTFERKARRPSLLAQNRGGRRQERKIDRSARIIIESGDDVYDVNDDDDVPPRFFILCWITIYVKEFCGRGGVSVQTKGKTDRPQAPPFFLYEWAFSGGLQRLPPRFGYDVAIWTVQGVFFSFFCVCVCVTCVGKTGKNVI